MSDIDPLNVPNAHKLPELKLCWVDSTNRRQVFKYLTMQYTPIEGKAMAEKLYGKALAPAVLKANGRIGVNEMELYAVKREIWEERQIEKKRESLRRREVAADEFEAEMDRFKRHGIRSFHSSREEFEDRKTFDTREGRPRVVVPDTTKASSSPASKD